MTSQIKSSRTGISNWFAKKLEPLLVVLRRGAEPKQLAFSGALGITLGVFPICGVTFFLCALAIAILRSACNAPTVMLANFAATPIELSLIIVFLRFGEFITGSPHFPLTTDALKKVLYGQASWEVVRSIFNALLGWAVAAPFIMGILYLLFLPISTYFVRKFSSENSSPRTLPTSVAAEDLSKTRYEDEPHDGVLALPLLTH